MSENNIKAPLMVKTIKLIHISLIIVPLIFGAVALYMNMTNPIGTEENMEIFIYIPPVLLIIAFIMSGIIFKQQVNVRRLEGKTLQQKLAAYQTAHLVRMALFEVAGLMAGVVTLLTANNYNLGVLVLVAALFYFMTPTASRIGIELALTHEERLQLEG